MAEAISLSDDVAITALVISLFALVVGLSQFLQAILGTAEGYRRCASSVIGPWSKLRSRDFRWSEFRYETKYVVPRIMLVTELEAVRMGDCYLLSDHDSARPWDRLPRLDKLKALGPVSVLTHRLGQQIKKRWQRVLGRLTVNEVLQQSLHLPDLDGHADLEDKQLPEDLAEQLMVTDGYTPQQSQQTAPTDEPSDLKIADLFNEFIKHDVQRAHRDGARNAVPVSWIPLLRDLHMLYLGYAFKSCPDDRSSSKTTSSSSTSLMIELALQSRRPATSMVATQAAVVPIQETWDFMPADISRPLASSTIATVIVLFLRLGLQWRTIDRARSQMNADGNGASVSSTDVRGLGMVLKFSKFSQVEQQHTIVPSRAADKLMCGIVPGDSALVKRDFDLIDRDRKLVSLCQPGSIYTQLGLDEKSTDLLRDQDRWTTHNEVVSLLCCFIPLCHTGGCDFYFSGWRGRQYSIFHFFEPRLALLVGLASAKHKSHTFEPLVDSLLALVNEFRYEFFDKYTTVKPEESIERRLNLARKCQEIFQFTSKFFDDHGYGKTNGTDRTWYMQLVAAHARLSGHVNKQPGPVKGALQEETMRNRRPLMEQHGIDSEYFAEHLYVQAERYIEAVENAEYGVVQYMQERAFRKSPASIVEAWWTLMIRGVVWDLSCRCLPYPGEPVPSSYYHDETSVWIT